MAYKHSKETREKMSLNGRVVSRPRKNSHFNHLNRGAFYSSWSGMKSRCLNPQNPSYERYGGRGITVDERWLDFANFYKDMYTKWLFHSKLFNNTSLDRIDNNMGYGKENCRWATRKQQANNRSSNRLLTLQGRTQQLKDWAEELGVSRTVITQRIDSYGWDIERALTTKVKKA